MYFSDLLEGRRLGAVLDRRERDIEALLECIGEFEAHAQATPGETLVAGLGRVTLEAQLEYLRAHRHLVEDESAAALSMTA